MYEKKNIKCMAEKKRKTLQHKKYKAGMKMCNSTG